MDITPHPAYSRPKVVKTPPLCGIVDATLSSHVPLADVSDSNTDTGADVSDSNTDTGANVDDDDDDDDDIQLRIIDICDDEEVETKKRKKNTEIDDEQLGRTKTKKRKKLEIGGTKKRKKKSEIDDDYEQSLSGEEGEEYDEGKHTVLMEEETPEPTQPSPTSNKAKAKNPPRATVPKTKQQPSRRPADPLASSDVFISRDAPPLFISQKYQKEHQEMKATMATILEMLKRQQCLLPASTTTTTGTSNNFEARHHPFPPPPPPPPPPPVVHSTSVSSMATPLTSKSLKEKPQLPCKILLSKQRNWKKKTDFKKVMADIRKASTYTVSGEFAESIHGSLKKYRVSHIKQIFDVAAELHAAKKFIANPQYFEEKLKETTPSVWFSADKTVQDWVTLTDDLSPEQCLSIARCGHKGEDVAWETEILDEPSYLEYVNKAVQIAIGWHHENELYPTEKCIQDARYACHKEAISKLTMTSVIDVVTAFKTHYRPQQDGSF